MTVVSSHSVATSTSSTLTRLPYEQRHWQLQYTNDDGTLGCTACPINYEEVYNLKGRLLTLVDATFQDPQQRKAFKDLVWQSLKGWFDDIERAGTWQPTDGDDSESSAQNAYLAHKATEDAP